MEIARLKRLELTPSTPKKAATKPAPAKLAPKKATSQPKPSAWQQDVEEVHDGSDEEQSAGIESSLLQSLLKL